MSLRKEIEKDLIELYDDMDPSGRNTTRLKETMSKMSDKQFYQYYHKFFKDSDQQFSIAYIPFEHGMTVEKITAVADKYNIPMWEYIYEPYLNGNVENPPGSVCKMLVLDYPIKRLQQMLFKKNHTATTITKRNPETGQVTDSDKTARVTDVEAYSLLVQEQYDGARELYSFRADDMVMKAEALKMIAETGEVRLDELTNDSMNKTTINTVNYYLLGACLMSNLVDSSGYMLPNTIKAKEERSTTIKRD